LGSCLVNNILSTRQLPPSSHAIPYPIVREVLTRIETLSLRKSSLAGYQTHYKSRHVPVFLLEESPQKQRSAAVAAVVAAAG